MDAVFAVFSVALRRQNQLMMVLKGYYIQPMDAHRLISFIFACVCIVQGELGNV